MHRKPWGILRSWARGGFPEERENVILRGDEVREGVKMGPGIGRNRQREPC